MADEAEESAGIIRPANELSTENKLQKSVGKLDNLAEAEDEENAQRVYRASSAGIVGAESYLEGADLQKAVSDLSFRPTDSGSTATAFQESGTSFVAAVHKKYISNEDEGHDALIRPVGDIILVPKSGPVKVTASGNIVLPRQVSMSGCEINVAGDLVQIQKMCQKVQELDLMENNIRSWEQVFSIIECIPGLTFLNLTKNVLNSALPEMTNRALPNLTHLVLNNTMISWHVLLQLLQVFPHIEELHLSLNGLESVNIPESSASASVSTSSTPLTSPELTNYPSLQRLFFVENNVLDWRDFNRLGAFFPNLRFLLVSATDLRSFRGSEDIPHCFSHLQTLGLNRTRLESWEEVEKLRLFPSLTDVRLSGIPFLEEFPEKFRRQHTVALLPNITSLNGSPIRDAEREDAERFYIRLYMNKEEKNSRYFELELKHGKLDPLAKVSLKPKQHIKVKVRVEGPNLELIKTEEMDIDVNQTVRDLVKLLSNVAGCPINKFQIYYQEVGGMGPDRLNICDRKLHSYSMRDGDELIIAYKE